MMYSEEAITFRTHVNSAMSDQIPWEMLLTLVESVCLTLEKSKEVNYLLLDELKTCKQTQSNHFHTAEENKVSSLPVSEVEVKEQIYDSAVKSEQQFVIKEENWTMRASICKLEYRLIRIYNSNLI